MRIDPVVHAQISAAFALLNDGAAVDAFPPSGSLSKSLSGTLPVGSRGTDLRNVTPTLAKMFVTGSVNIWMRGVHSFLVSCSLTSVSPVWTSVAGYYSSHYSVRALAHLLGFFQLFARKRIVRLELAGGRYLCNFDPKTAGDREHRVYWKIVKRDSHFATDPLFTENKPAIDEFDQSDVSHRDRANYTDHLPQFPTFRPLDVAALRSRINRISEIEFATPPIPRAGLYPDIESVQIVAYHRLVRFRSFVDALVGDENRFWNVHRDPVWARDFLDYQLTEKETLKSQYVR
jgi:hypothetical protein